MPKSHLGIGAGKKIHMLYKALKRRQAAEAAGDAEAAGITIPCPACAGKHRAHTCARGLTQPRAAPGEKAATAARLGAATAAPAAGSYKTIPTNATTKQNACYRI